MATRLHCLLSLHPQDLGQTAGSAATDVCLSASAVRSWAHISFLSSQPVTYPPVSGVGGGGLISVCPRKSGKAWQTGKIVESNIKTWCAVSHAVKHLLVRRKQTHTCTAQTRRLTHLASQEAMGPVGQSKLESLVHLFTSNYRNRTISATTASAFFSSLPWEWTRGKKREKDRALTGFFPAVNGWLSHPLSAAERWEEGVGGLLYYKVFHFHVAWTFARH